MSTELRRTPSDQVLRTLAPVPVSSSILDLGCGAGEHTEALLRLGFPVRACDPRPEAVRKARHRVRDLVDEETARSCVREAALGELDDLDATFDWVVAVQPEIFLDSREDLSTVFENVHSLLEPGGWLYLAVPAPLGDNEQSSPDEAPSALDDAAICFTASDLEASKLDIPLREARSPSLVNENEETRVHAIYRRVGAQTPI